MTENKSIHEIIKREKRRCAMGLDLLCDWDFAHDSRENPEAYCYARNYADHFAEMKREGTGLFLFGSAGSGKSFMAAEIVNELTDHGRKCQFTSLLTILGDLSTLAYEGRRNYLNQLLDHELLVLDDLGAELDSGYSNQILMQIINTCHLKKVPIIVTTPYHEETLKDCCNAKRLLALSRLLSRSKMFTVQMPDARRNDLLRKKRKTEALLQNAEPVCPPCCDESWDMEYPDTIVTECLAGPVQQTLPLETAPQRYDETINNEKECGQHAGTNDSPKH